MRIQYNIFKTRLTLLVMLSADCTGSETIGIFFGLAGSVPTSDGVVERLSCTPRFLNLFRRFWYCGLCINFTLLVIVKDYTYPVVYLRELHPHLLCQNRLFFRQRVRIDLESYFQPGHSTVLHESQQRIGGKRSTLGPTCFFPENALSGFAISGLLVACTSLTIDRALVTLD